METKEAGRIGGLRRALKLTAEQRSEGARLAVNTRWAKTSTEQRSEFARKMLIARWSKEGDQKNLSLPKPATKDAGPFYTHAGSWGVTRKFEKVRNSAQRHLLDQLRTIAQEARMLSRETHALPWVQRRERIDNFNEFLSFSAEFSKTKAWLDREIAERG